MQACMIILSSGLRSTNSYIVCYLISASSSVTSMHIYTSISILFICAWRREYFLVLVQLERKSSQNPLPQFQNLNKILLKTNMNAIEKLLGVPSGFVQYVNNRYCSLGNLSLITVFIMCVELKDIWAVLLHTEFYRIYIGSNYPFNTDCHVIPKVWKLYLCYVTCVFL